MKYLCLLALVAFSFYAQAQAREQNQASDTLFHPFKPKEITIGLTPIIVERGKYYYEGKRVRFAEIVLPLMATNDAVVLRRIKTVHTMTDARRIIFYAELAYVLYLQTNAAAASGQQVWFTFLGIIIFNELYNLSTILVQKKAIDRYNEVVLQPSFSLGQRGAPTLGFTIRF